MTASKAWHQAAQPEPDPSIALMQAAREQCELEILARDELIERAKRERTEYMAAMLVRGAGRLKSLFRVSAHPTISLIKDR
jgi:hypothetical protein